MNNYIGYVTQSPDTHIEAELVQFKLWREMSSVKKFNLFKRLLQKGSKLAMMGIEHQFPALSPLEKTQLYLKKRGIYLDFTGELMIEDPLWLASYLGDLLESLDISYYITGSVASSLQGEVRFTEDLDLVIQIELTQVNTLIDRLKDDFYISEIAVDEAMRGLISSFNIIHFQTTEKADIFINRSDEFSLSKMKRRQLYVSQNEQGFYICSPEDSILQKLLWFGLSEGQSQKQWRDILGVLKLQGNTLNFSYLSSWSEKIGVQKTLEMALLASGLSDNN